jgi:hypothetical protein
VKTGSIVANDSFVSRSKNALTRSTREKTQCRGGGNWTNTGKLGAKNVPTLSVLAATCQSDEIFSRPSPTHRLRQRGSRRAAVARWRPPPGNSATTPCSQVQVHRGGGAHVRRIPSPDREVIKLAIASAAHTPHEQEQQQVTILRATPTHPSPMACLPLPEGPAVVLAATLTAPYPPRCVVQMPVILGPPFSPLSSITAAACIAWAVSRFTTSRFAKSPEHNACASFRTGRPPAAAAGGGLQAGCQLISSFAVTLRKHCKGNGSGGKRRRGPRAKCHRITAAGRPIQICKLRYPGCTAHPWVESGRVRWWDFQRATTHVPALPHAMVEISASRAPASCLIIKLAACPGLAHA